MNAEKHYLEKAEHPPFTVLQPDQAVSGADILTDVKIVIEPETGAIAKIGPVADVDAWLAAEAEEKKQKRGRVEHFGGVAIAGLTDAHEHPVLYATLQIMQAGSLHGVSTKEAVLERLREVTNAVDDPRKPVVLLGLDTSKVSGLVADDIRSTIGERDAVIFDASFHGGVVSKEMGAKIEALAKAEGKPLAGHLSKDGSVTEEYGLKALDIAEASFSIERMERAVAEKLDTYLTQGITACHDMAVPTTNEFIAALLARRRWKTERKTGFPITRFHLRKEQMETIARQLPELEKAGLLTAEEFPELVGLKLFADGSFGSRTALLSEEYRGTGGKGIVFDRDEVMSEAMQVAVQKGVFSVAMHAIGDSGIQRAIGAAREWIRLAEERKFEPKFRIEHFELPLPLEATLAETKSIGVWVVPQPNFLLDYIYEDRLGERVRWVCPHQKILDEKIPMMFGTDGMPDSMLYAIYLATHAVEPHQRLSFSDALLASTLTAAHFEGDARGAIKEGHKADIILADPALLRKLAAGAPDVSWNPDKIAELEGHIRSVYKDGVEVYSRFVS